MIIIVQKTLSNYPYKLFKVAYARNSMILSACKILLQVAFKQITKSK